MNDDVAHAHTLTHTLVLFSHAIPSQSEADLQAKVGNIFQTGAKY